MNPTVIRLTSRALLGRRRALLLALLPGLMLLVAVLTRWGSGPGLGTEAMSYGFTLGILVPVISLLIGTGVIGPEIEDHSLMYLLAKPVRRSTVALSKLAVGYWAAFVFAVVPVVLATLISGDPDGVYALRYGLAALIASVVYVTLFFALAILLRNAVIAGLVYALMWEGTLAAWVPGAQTLSVRQWGLAIAERVADGPVNGAVSLTTAITLSIAVLVAAGALAVRGLNRLQFRGDD